MSLTIGELAGQQWHDNTHGGAGTLQEDNLGNSAEACWYAPAFDGSIIEGVYLSPSPRTFLPINPAVQHAAHSTQHSQ